MEKTWVLVASGARAVVLAAHAGTDPVVLEVIEQPEGVGAAFARDLAFRLDAAQDAGKYDRLGLVCEQDMLSALRSALQVQVSARVVFEHARDIAHWPEPHLVAAVRAAFADEGAARRKRA